MIKTTLLAVDSWLNIPSLCFGLAVLEWSPLRGSVARSYGVFLARFRHKVANESIELLHSKSVEVNLSLESVNQMRANVFCLVNYY